MIKLVFLFSTKVLAIYEQEFGIAYFRQKGYDIEIFDMSPIITPIAAKCVTKGIYEGMDIITFFTKKQYRDYVRALSGDVVFISHDYNRLESRFLFTSLRKEQIHGFLWTGSCIPVNKKSEVKRYFRYLSFNRICNSVYARLPHWIQGIPPAAFLIRNKGNGQGISEKRLCRNENTIIKYVQSQDFEQYLKVKSRPQERLIKEKYCVFLDQFIGYHPDRAYLEIFHTQEEIELYYLELRDFFHFVEKSMDVKVIVALHPRADYSEHPECYEGFTTYKFKTPELIKDCEFVLTHVSEAQSYVMAFHKPALAISGTMFKNTLYFTTSMQIFAKRFQVEVIDISNKSYENINLNDFLVIDKEFYNECIRQLYYSEYVDENTPVIPLWEQVEEVIIMAINKNRREVNNDLYK